MEIQEMVDLLSSKLTKEEFLILQEMIDSDPPAGPLWEAMTDRAIELDPSNFVS